MISASLFRVEARFADGSVMDLSAEDCSVTGFTFRLTKEDAARFLAGKPALRCTVCTLREQGSFPVPDPRVTVEEEEEFWVRIRVILEDPAFMAGMRSLTEEIRRYVRLKNGAGDAELSQEYTGYPAKEEMNFAPDFMTARKEMLSGLKADEAWESVARSVPERAMAVCSPGAAERFLHLKPETYWKERLEETGLSDHPLAELSPNTVYFGNMGCFRLFPEETELAALLNRAPENHLRPVVMLPPMTEDRTEWAASVLQNMDRWLPRDFRLEVVVNDPGLPLLIRERFPDRFLLTAGPLLIRRRKDPRMAWWSGKPALLDQTSANSAAFREALRSVGIGSVSWEACGYPFETEPGDVLHLPFFQLSTATACTLRAVARSGRRGDQRPGEKCAMECERFCFLYGRGTGILSRGNSLFGLDSRIMTDSAALRRLLNGKIRRIVVDPLS